MPESPGASRHWPRNVRAILLLACVLMALGTVWCFDLQWQGGGGMAAFGLGFGGFLLCLYMRRFTRMRFRMTDLLVLTTLVAVGLGAFVQVARVRHSERILDQLRKQGARIRYVVDFEHNELGNGYFVSQSGKIIPNWCTKLLGKSYFSPLLSISFEQSPVTIADYDLAVFGRIPSFRNLNLSNTTVTKAGLRNLKAPTQLEVLTLRPDQLDQPTAKDLRARFSQLKKIRVARSAILRDSDAANLPYFDDVSQVKLFDTRISNAAIRSLCRLPSLLSLTIGEQTKITSPGLALLQQIKSIEQIEIHEIQQVDVADFASFEHVYELQFHRCTFTDTSFRVLGRLPSIRRVAINHFEQLSEQDVADLAQIRQLDSINVQHCPLSIAGLRQLATLPLARELLFSGVPINDETIGILRSMRALRGIHVNNVPNGQGKALKLMREIPRLDAVWVNGEHFHRQAPNEQDRLQQALDQQQSTTTKE